MPVFNQVFHEIAALLAVAAAVGAVGLRLRQPLIVTFIAVGVLVGPAGFAWVSAADQVDLLAKLGIALLLFVVGLKLDLHLIRTLGSVALATGLGQVLFTSVVGYFIALALGLSPVASLYVAVALTFSSTIIIVKLLSDKKEIDALHGRIAVGFLIVQDLVVVLAMILLAAFGAGGKAGGLGLQLALVMARGAAFLGMILVAMRWILPRLLRQLARSQEMLILFAVTWAVVLAALGDILGFSKEVGAFLAGVSLASTPFRESIGARLVTLRDFLLLFFFVDLGAQLDLAFLGAQLAPALIFSAFVLIGNPLIVMVIMGAMGYRRRTGFLAGLTVAQISEFSLILTAIGVSLGHLDREVLGLVTLVGLITIGLSTYMILYSHQLYGRLEPWLAVFERGSPHREREFGDIGDTGNVPAEVILFGLGRYGSGMARELSRRGLRVLGVDFDPEVVEGGPKKGLLTRYGDAEDPEFPATLPLSQAHWVICTIPGKSVNLALLQALRHHGYTGRVALTAHTEGEKEPFRAAGAAVILLPFLDAAREAVDMLTVEPIGLSGDDGSAA